MPAARRLSAPAPRRLLLCLAALLLLGAGCADTDDGAGDPAASTSSAPGAADSAFVSEEGKFRVALPGKPTRLLQQQPVGEVVLDVVLYNVEVGDDFAYQVAFVDYPESLGPLDPDGVLQGAASGAAGAVGGTITSSKRQELIGHPSIAFEIELESAHVAARSLLVGRRLYTLQAVSARPPAPDFDRMVSSFELI